MTTGTCSRWANNRPSDWPSPAPTTPTFVTGRASFLSGAPTGRFARFCTRSKEYKTGPQVVAHDQVGQGFVLCREALLTGGGLRQCDQVQGAVGAGVEPFRRASSDARTLATVSSHAAPRSTSVRSHAHRAGEHLRRPQQRLLEEVRGLQHDVGDAEVQNLRRQAAGSATWGCR